MYKEHLVNNVTSSLSDLANFLREADEGITNLAIINYGNIFILMFVFLTYYINK